LGAAAAATSRGADAREGVESPHFGATAARGCATKEKKKVFLWDFQWAASTALLRDNEWAAMKAILSAVHSARCWAASLALH
jgi:hypothetical protein